jgi:hypothetical protein
LEKGSGELVLVVVWAATCAIAMLVALAILLQPLALPAAEKALSNHK